MALTIKFDDSGLHLAVINALLRDGVLDESTVIEKLEPARALPRPTGEMERAMDDDDRIAAAVRLLHNWPMDRNHAIGVELVTFDGSNPIYALIHRAMGVAPQGECEHYRLRSLMGIGGLEALTTLDLWGYGHRRMPLDLTPLEGRAALRRLTLCGACTRSVVLERLPSLQTLRLRNATLDDSSVIERLEERGVRVSRS